MSDIKLFRTEPNKVIELTGKSVALEKSLQTLIELHMEDFFGVRFLASEYSTGKTHSGRIDTLGMDENGCPCIIEYKRSRNENVINQGLFYLDWLLDHKAEFELLVIKILGEDASENIEWSNPRLLCIAGGFNKYDGHAVQQINRNIDLIRYLRFDEELLLLELVNTVEETKTPSPIGSGRKPPQRNSKRTLENQLAIASVELLDLLETLKATCEGFGDDVQVKSLKLYLAFKRLKNFVTVVVNANANTLICYLRLNPDTIPLEDGFTQDLRKKGHWGTGDLELVIKNQSDLEKAIPLLQKSYEGA